MLTHFCVDGDAEEGEQMISGGQTITLSNLLYDMDQINGETDQQSNILVGNSLLFK